MHTRRSIQRFIEQTEAWRFCYRAISKAPPFSLFDGEWTDLYVLMWAGDPLHSILWCGVVWCAVPSGCWLAGS